MLLHKPIICLKTYESFHQCAVCRSLAGRTDRNSRGKPSQFWNLSVSATICWSASKKEHLSKYLTKPKIKINLLPTSQDAKSTCHSLQLRISFISGVTRKNLKVLLFVIPSCIEMSFFCSFDFRFYHSTCLTKYVYTCFGLVKGVFLDWDWINEKHWPTSMFFVFKLQVDVTLRFLVRPLTHK